jgi:hypothetical protein
MSGTTSYRVSPVAQAEPGTFEVIDESSGLVVAVSRPEIEPGNPSELTRGGWLRRAGSGVARFAERSRIFRALLTAVVLPFALLYAVGGLLGIWRLHTASEGARIDVDRPGGGWRFSLVSATGVFYDGLRVLDECGKPSFHFISRFKTTLAGGFGVVDLTGHDEGDSPRLHERPWIGHVSTAGGTYQLRLVVGDVAARFQRDDSGSVRIELVPGRRDDKSPPTLVLAAALALVWRP